MSDIRSFNDLRTLYETYRNSREHNSEGIDIEELRDLATQIYRNRDVLSTENFQELRDMILADQIIDNEERKLLLLFGIAADQTLVNQAIEEYSQNPVDSSLSSIISRGLQERQEQTDNYTENNTLNSMLRDLGSDLINILGGGNPDERIRIADSDEAANIQTINNIIENSRIFEFAGENTDCIRLALEEISQNSGAFTLAENSKSEIISEEYLNRVTGQEWDSILLYDKSNPELRLQPEVLQNQEGKALVVVGTHTFIFQGFDENGDLRVTDPSDGNVNRTISVDNKAATVYVMGEGDGNRTDIRSVYYSSKGTRLRELVHGERSVKSYEEIMVDESEQKNPVNSADRARSEDPSEIERARESKEIRKLFILMGDPSKSDVVRNIGEIIEDENLSAEEKTQRLQTLLLENNINLDTQETSAMIRRLGTEVQGNRSMIDLFELLNNGNDKNPHWNEARIYYQVGIQYSDIDLSNYFTNTSPEKMYRVFSEMIEGKTGC